jgi:hypothetical protein
MVVESKSDALQERQQCNSVGSGEKQQITHFSTGNDATPIQKGQFRIAQTLVTHPAPDSPNLATKLPAIPQPSSEIPKPPYGANCFRSMRAVIAVTVATKEMQWSQA